MTAAGRRKSTPPTNGPVDDHQTRNVWTGREIPMLSFSVSVGPDRAMSEADFDRLNAYAIRVGRTRSEVVTAAVLRYLAEANRRTR